MNTYEQTLVNDLLYCNQLKNGCEADLRKATDDLRDAMLQLEQQTPLIVPGEIPADTAYQTQPIADGTSAKEGVRRLIKMDIKHAGKPVKMIKTTKAAPPSSTSTSTPTSTSTTTSTTTATSTTTVAAATAICDECPLFGDLVAPVLEAHFGPQYPAQTEDKQVAKLKDYLHGCDTLQVSCSLTNEDNRKLKADLKKCTNKKVFQLPEVCQQHLEECRRSPSKYRRRRRLDNTFKDLIGFRADRPIPPEEAECKACTAELRALKVRMHERLSKVTTCETKLNSTIDERDDCHSVKEADALRHGKEKTLLQDRADHDKIRIANLEQSNIQERAINAKLVQQQDLLEEELRQCRAEIRTLRDEAVRKDEERGRMQLRLDRLDRVEEHNVNLATANAVLLETDQHRGIKDEYLGDPILMDQSLNDNPKIRRISISLIIIPILLLVAAIIMAALLCREHRRRRAIRRLLNDVNLIHFRRTTDEEAPPPEEPVRDPEVEAGQPQDEDTPEVLVDQPVAPPQDDDGGADNAEEATSDLGAEPEVPEVLPPQLPIPPPPTVPPPPTIPLPPIPEEQRDNRVEEDDDGDDTSLYANPDEENDYEDIDDLDEAAHAGERAAGPLTNGDVDEHAEECQTTAV